MHIGVMLRFVMQVGDLPERIPTHTSKRCAALPVHPIHPAGTHLIYQHVLFVPFRRLCK